MQYYSTNGKAPLATLEEAVVRGLAPDKGLYMPQEIRPLPQEFFDNIENHEFPRNVISGGTQLLRRRRRCRVAT